MFKRNLEKDYAMKVFKFKYISFVSHTSTRLEVLAYYLLNQSVQ